jgi:hypothetical protein
MLFAVDAWQADYGSATEPEALAPSEVATRIDVEVAPAEWAPRRPGPDVAPALVVHFVDGVRRVEARVWITEPDGRLFLGIAASYAAGVVRCDGQARVVASAVERRLFTAAASAVGVTTRHGDFPVVATTAETPDELSLDLQHQMGLLERRVAAEAAAGGTSGEGLVIVDGPLRAGAHPGGTVGSIKTQHRSYGPPIVQQTVAALGAGERTPLFLVGGPFACWSWYVRLPGPVPHPLASVVRCVVDAEAPRESVSALADTVTSTLPKFASSPAKDPRAPQNLYPIAGLERELRHRLGDPQLILRGLRLAASGVITR